MPNEKSELEQRRDELTRSLPALGEKRANTYRRNSDARARPGWSEERAADRAHATPFSRREVGRAFRGRTGRERVAANRSAEGRTSPVLLGLRARNGARRQHT
jgi:hypothetical protein